LGANIFKKFKKSCGVFVCI